MNKKEIKKLKNEIVEKSALNVGYYPEVKQALLEVNPDILKMVMNEVGESLTIEAQKWNSDFDNVFVSEAVRLISYHEFKQVAKYFFGYTKTEDEILAEPITISRDNYQALQYSASKRFRPSEIVEKVEHITTDKVPNGRSAVAYNPVTDELAILNNYGVDMYDLDENLISNYKSGKPEELLVAETLIHKGNIGLVDALNKATQRYLKKSEVNESEVIDWTANYISGFNPKAVSWINSLLETGDMELVVHNVAVDESERVIMTYFIPSHEYYDRDFAVNYMEQQVEPYYLGNLCELAIFNKDNQIERMYKTDGATFINNPLDSVKKITGQADFIDINTAIKMQSNNELKENNHSKKM